MDDGNGLIQRRTCNKFEIEKSNTPVWCLPNILLWLSLNGIQLKCIAIEFNLGVVFGVRIVCVYLLVLFLSDFIAISTFNEQQISAFILICNDWGVIA